MHVLLQNLYISQDIFKHCTDEGISSVTEIPYFDGDFWPNVIEETIKELNQEAQEREASEQAITDVSIGTCVYKYTIIHVCAMWWALNRNFILCCSNVHVFVCGFVHTCNVHCTMHINV